MARVLLKLSPCAGAFTDSTPMSLLTLRSAVALCLGAARPGRMPHRSRRRGSSLDSRRRVTGDAGCGSGHHRAALRSRQHSRQPGGRARTPRPQTATLDTLFARFRGPFTRYTDASYRASQLRDSLDQLRRGRTAARARPLSLSGWQTPFDCSSGKSVAPGASSTARGPSSSAGARARAPRFDGGKIAPTEDTTASSKIWPEPRAGSPSPTRPARPDGPTSHLPAGRWWIYARAWDTSDPNAEWYWNLPVQEDTVLLSSRTGRRRPRY